MNIMLQQGAYFILRERAKIPLKAFATYCARSGAVGAAVDATIGAIEGVRDLQDGEATKVDVVKHTPSEAACGFTTSATGTAGTLAVYMLTGNMGGPMGVLVGMGSSIFARHLYRRALGETLPSKRDAAGEEP